MAWGPDLAADRCWLNPVHKLPCDGGTCHLKRQLCELMSCGPASTCVSCGILYTGLR